MSPRQQRAVFSQFRECVEGENQPRTHRQHHWGKSLFSKCAKLPSHPKLCKQHKWALSMLLQGPGSASYPKESAWHAGLANICWVSACFPTQVADTTGTAPALGKEKAATCMAQIAARFVKKKPESHWPWETACQGTTLWNRYPAEGFILSSQAFS